MKVLLLTLQNPPPSLKGTSFSKSFHNFVDICLQKDPAKRPTATQLLEHKFFKQSKKVDYIKQTLLKNLPPLWERVKLNIKLPFDDESDGGSSPSSWNFESNGELLETVLTANSPAAGSPASTVTNQTNDNTPTNAEQKVNQVVKGRFTKTVISKVSTPSLTSTQDKSEEDPERNQLRLSGSIDPLYLMGELNKQVSAIMKENEKLKAENAALRKELQATRSHPGT
uniref:Protein kinase domain-containing protein n=2 Tax=Vannella robusta TaxID=1487602 RepID=A0A7S4MFA6_9EUKA|mmetsp:Transcript_20435/g.25876  ORF Transcript_20435/g.25876 Transcript_20435/m.25876 type:complete len:226 (+) Transcript_20435:45-722(+)